MNTNILKTQTVSINPNVNVGRNNLILSRPTTIHLPGGTHLNNGTIRLLCKADNNIDAANNNNHDMELIDNYDIPPGRVNATENNIKFYHDNINNVYSTIPKHLPNLQPNEGCYCKLLEGTSLKFKDDLNEIKLTLSENEWFSLHKETVIKFPSNTMIEMKVGTEWYKVKTTGAESFTI